MEPILRIVKCQKIGRIMAELSLKTVTLFMEHLELVRLAFTAAGFAKIGKECSHKT